MTRDSHLLVAGIDPGLKCGFAYGFIETKTGKISYPRPHEMGYWHLSLGDYDSGTMRWVRLRQFVKALKPDIIMMESFDMSATQLFRNPAILSSSLKAVEVLACAKATIALLCEQRGIPCGTVRIAEVKKRATGRGNSNKEEIIAACNEEFQTAFDLEDYHHTGADNVADAVYMAAIALEGVAQGLTE